MAKYSVTHTCGHTDTHQLYGPGKERDRKISWLETTLCSDCYKADQDAKREAANIQAAQANSDAGLPTLTGSEKQIAWAESIRAKALAQAWTPDNEIGKRLYARIQSQSEARWWIDNRSKDIAGLIELVMDADDYRAIDSLIPADRFVDVPAPETMMTVAERKPIMDHLIDRTAAHAVSPLIMATFNNGEEASRILASIGVRAPKYRYSRFYFGNMYLGYTRKLAQAKPDEQAAIREQLRCLETLYQIRFCGADKS